MSYPSRQVTGNIYTSGGVIVTAGRISARLIPSGVVVPDTSTSTLYSVGTVEQGLITPAGITSFYLTVLESANPRDAFYEIKKELSVPYADTWYELWRVTGASSGPLPVGEMVPFGYGPYGMQRGYLPVQFVPAGAITSISSPSLVLVNSLPSVLTAADKNKLFLHTRTSSLGDALWWVGTTRANTLALIFIGEAP